MSSEALGKLYQFQRIPTSLFMNSLSSWHYRLDLTAMGFPLGMRLENKRGASVLSTGSPQIRIEGFGSAEVYMNTGICRIVLSQNNV